MSKIKSFKEFLEESYLEKPIDPETLGFDEKKMKKNGYIEVTVIEKSDELEEGDKLLTSATEFGQLEDDAMVTCYKEKEVILVPKKKLQPEIK